jgi:hypothetical protein
MAADLTEPSPRRTGHRRAWAVLVVVLLIVAILTGLGWSYSNGWIGGGSHADLSDSDLVQILPSPGTKSQCITQGPGAPEAILPLQYGALQTNVYSAPNGTAGAVGMCYNAASGTLFNYVNWSEVGGKGGWFSYPQVAYGVDQFEGSTDTYTGQGSNWVLPQSEAAVVGNPVWVTATYNYNEPTGNTSTGDDISFDNYLTPGSTPTWKVQPWVEVLVLLDHEIWSYPSGWANWSMPTLVNSTISDQPWSIGYWCHGKANGSSNNITFDFSYGGSPRLVKGLAAGTMGVNLSAVIDKVAAMLPSASCYTGNSSTFSTFNLGQEVFGAEAGVHTNSSFVFNWTISQYCIHVDVANPSPANVSCTATGPAAAVGGPVPGAGTSGGASALGAAPRPRGEPR